MYVDYRISIGLPILREALNNSRNEVLKKICGKNVSLDLEDEDTYYNFKEKYEAFITNDRSTRDTVNGTYVGTYYLCVDKAQSEVSNFPLLLNKGDLERWEKETAKLKKVCGILDIEFSEDKLCIIVDSENY